MAEHFSKATVQAKVWCKRCGKATMHSVWDGRRGSCFKCSSRPTSTARKAPASERTGNLFRGVA